MGYANSDQVASGILQRLWSRTFILANTLTGPRIVLVTLDIHAGSQIVKLEVCYIGSHPVTSPGCM